MGVSVTLYFPIRNELSAGRPVFAADRLHLTLDDGAREFVEAWTVWGLPGGLQRYTEETGLETTHTDSYGDPLTWTHAAEIQQRPRPWEGCMEWTFAVFAFLFRLPPEQLVILDWD
jgi:hypothetical protein